MKGSPTRKSGWRAILTHPSTPLLGGVIVLVGAAALLATLTMHAPPLATRHGRKNAATTAAANVVSGVSDAPAFGHDAPAPPIATPPVPPAATTTTAAPTSNSTTSTDITKLPLNEIRQRAARNDPPAMIELARRLITGIGIAKDPAAGAGWMLHAAERGSAQAAFNVGVMYESGFVVDRDSTQAAEWYRRASDAGLPAAQHNLALLLRVGKGVPRDGPQTLELLHAAARQGMTASMFALGDIYEQGDIAPKDLAAAAAWFTITVTVERQAKDDSANAALGKKALQRVQVLQRILTPAQRARAQDMTEKELQAINDTINPPDQGPLPPPALPPPAPAPSASSVPAGPPKKPSP
jgi:hypothetical protein